MNRRINSFWSIATILVAAALLGGCTHSNGREPNTASSLLKDRPFATWFEAQPR